GLSSSVGAAGLLAYLLLRCRARLGNGSALATPLLAVGRRIAVVRAHAADARARSCTAMHVIPPWSPLRAGVLTGATGPNLRPTAVALRWGFCVRVVTVAAEDDQRAGVCRGFCRL